MAKSNTISPARIAAFDVLKQVEDGTFSSIALAAKEPELSPLDRALCHELVLGVLRWQLQLDRIIEHFAGRKSDALDRPVLRALRLGVYQLRFLTRIPASAAVNESVKLVARARLTSARSFVNAVLRRITREPEYSPVSNIHDPIERISVETSHPPWLVERWATAFGLEQTELLARANNETPAVAFRIVNSVEQEEHVMAQLFAAGVEPVRSLIAQHGWRVSGATGAVREMTNAGAIYIQDEASQLVGELLCQTMTSSDRQYRILDVCSAPGGKTTLVADREGEGVLIVAMDSSKSRLATVARTAQLHRLKNIRLVVADAGASLPVANQGFARVLLDAPCSGTGTLRHNPEIRWRLSNNDIKRLAEQQTRFLLNANTAVEPGGYLVYSTCSLEKDENEAVVAQFLATNGSFQQVPAVGQTDLLTEAGAIRTWPHRDDTDGFYIAVLKRELSEGEG